MHAFGERSELLLHDTPLSKVTNKFSTKTECYNFVIRVKRSVTEIVPGCNPLFLLMLLGVILIRKLTKGRAQVNKGANLSLQRGEFKLTKGRTAKKVIHNPN